jgi:DnaK suppressor protein
LYKYNYREVTPMPNMSSSNHAPRIVSSKHPNTHMRKSANYADLQNELHRLRTVLAHETMMSHLVAAEPELFPDPIDQAASEHELDIALSVKLLAIEKLRRIEQALSSLHAHSYGVCSHCGQAIPYARLKVQPDSLYCVPCLTVIEQKSAGN